MHSYIVEIYVVYLYVLIMIIDVRRLLSFVHVQNI